MCVLFIAVEQHPRYRLIIAANRDERHARPSAPMHYWRAHPDVLAGRDGAAGGAWFGVNARGQFAALANHHGAPPAADKRSRGQLIADWLTNPSSARDEYAQTLRARGGEFNPVNLIYGDATRLNFFSNVGAIAKPLGRGLHAIGNGAIDDANDWPKIARGTTLLREIITRDDNRREMNRAALFAMMRDQTVDYYPADDSAAARETAIAKQRRDNIFIRGEHYGTRATTLLLATATQLEIRECNYNSAGAPTEQRKFLLTIDFNNN